MRELDVKVSIVIPIYNVEKYVEQCLVSVQNQTLKEIEIICIDDASTDASLSLIQKYAKTDQRMKVIAYDTNKSASQARKDGALQAKGEYVMFLDGDDYMEQDACQNLYQAIKNKGADILHFGTNIINVGHANEGMIANLKALLRPYCGELTGKKVFEGCFIEKKFRFSIWNKIYKRELCKKAFSYVEDGNYPKAQDLYAFFILCYFADSYFGISEAYYNYRFGAGITGQEELSLEQLERYCHSVYVAEAVHEFVMGQKAGEYEQVTLKIRKDLLSDCVANWFSAVRPKDAGIGFDILCRYWERKEIVVVLSEKYYTERKMLAEKIRGAKVIQSKKKESVKTIGIFYYRYTLGGVERVISLLIPMYMEMGYKVILFTDELIEGKEYDLPKAVERVLLPSALGKKKSQYMERADVLCNKISEYGIDVMHYHAASSTMILFDMLLLKLHYISVVITVHEPSFQNLLTISTEMVNRPAIYRIADCVTVLSQADKKYWECLGVHAFCIPNPINMNLITRDISKVEKNTILWIGRLDVNIKQCLDVVDVMEYVVRSIPDAKLMILGDEATSGVKDLMKKKIEKHKLEKNILLCGYDANVEPYYNRCELHIMTSVSESFSMVIAESKAYGMPLVMYELPFIEFSRDMRGAVSVPQRDVKAMAKAIVEILCNESYKKQLQQGAHDSLRDFLNFDLKKEWNKIFLELAAGDWDVQNQENEIMGILLRSFLQHYQYGATRNNNEKNALKRKKQELQNSLEEQRQELNKIKNSWDFKLGHFVFFVPHKFVGYIRNLKNKWHKERMCGK